MSVAVETTAEEVRRRLHHRAVGARILRGDGLEIGALHYPLPVPPSCRVEYLDVEDEATLRARFPELERERLVAIHHTGDIVRATVPALTGRRYDFVALNHVLEHLANPIQAFANAWAGVRDGGHLVVSVPDKSCTYDRPRALTAFEHCLGDYYRGVTEVDADHYVEFLAATSPEAWSDRDAFARALARAAARREHAHVWDSTSFRAFLDRTVALLGLHADVVFESTAATNRFEYFAVLGRAGRPKDVDERAFEVLCEVYRGRTDLADAMPAAAPRFAERLLRWAVTSGATIDSAAPLLRPFQAVYRRWLDGTLGDLERRLREDA
jgi:hypothetical protein